MLSSRMRGRSGSTSGVKPAHGATIRRSPRGHPNEAIRRSTTFDLVHLDVLGTASRGSSAAPHLNGADGVEEFGEQMRISAAVTVAKLQSAA